MTTCTCSTSWASGNAASVRGFLTLFYSVVYALNMDKAGKRTTRAATTIQTTKKCTKAEKKKRKTVNACALERVALPRARKPCACIVHSTHATVPACAQRTGAAAHGSLRRDRPGGLTLAAAPVLFAHAVVAVAKNNNASATPSHNEYFGQPGNTPVANTLFGLAHDHWRNPLWAVAYAIAGCIDNSFVFLFLAIKDISVISNSARNDQQTSTHESRCTVSQHHSYMNKRVPAWWPPAASCVTNFFSCRVTGAPTPSATPSSPLLES